MSKKDYFVAEYDDSENNEHCLVLVKGIKQFSSYQFVQHIGNINLQQRFFIKGDKSQQPVIHQTNQSITLSNQTVMYPLESYFETNKDRYDDIIKLIESIQTPYRYSNQTQDRTKDRAKIIFF
jgi:hypothetical protein